MASRLTLPALFAVAAVSCGGSTFDPTGTASGSPGQVGGSASDSGTGVGGGTAAGGAASTGGAAGTGVGGGTAAGGAAGTGGAAGGAAECTSAADCGLFTDCCTCAPVKKGTLMASCNMACKQNDCAARGIDAEEVTCIAGRCVFDRTCNPALVTCKIMPPACGAGQAPLVVGSCYAGGCAPVAYCSEVASCGACKATGLACATFQLLFPPGQSGLHCVTTPDRCMANPTCACMGACTPYQCMQPDSTNLLCQCPNC